MTPYPIIRTPWIQWWRRLRYQVFPVLIFVGAVTVTGWLWSQHVALPNSVGEAYAQRVDVAAPADGLLVGVPGSPLEVFQTVKAGQLLARIDARQAIATLVRMQYELAHLRLNFQTAELSSNDRQSAYQQESDREARNLAMEVERLRLVIVEQQGLLETDKAELARLNTRYDAYKPLVERGLESQIALIDIDMQREVVKQRIEGTRKALAEAETQKAAAEGRLKTFSAAQVAGIEKLLAPIRDGIAVEEARLPELRQQIGSVEIRAPIDGTIAAVFCSPGQDVKLGLPIITIASPQTEFVQSYVRENQRIQPEVGMEVEVEARALPKTAVRASITQVGAQVEPIPTHQLRDPRVLEWGIPVRINRPQGLDVRPGELVDVAFRPGTGTGKP